MSQEGGQHDDLMPEPAMVREQLGRVLSSAEFGVPERSRRFLAYIVDEALAGRGASLKAYAIAQAVFGRDASFDAQNDPVVRIEAGRIRRALERYYLVAGRCDPVQITIPKGGYIPTFVFSAAAAGSKVVLVHRPDEMKRGKPFRYQNLLLSIVVILVLSAVVVPVLIKSRYGSFDISAPLFSPLAPAEDVSRPQIVVEPLVGRGGENGDASVAKGLTDELIAQLTRIKRISVKTAAPDADLAASHQPQLSMQGSLAVEGSRLHVQILLVDYADGTVVWAQTFDRNIQGQSILDVQNELAQKIADAISTRR